MARYFFARTAAALSLVLALGACATMPAREPANDAPLGAGVNIPAGSNEDFIVNVGRRIFFAENSSALDETALETLGKQAKWLTDYPAYKIKIEGFADDPGTPQSNLALGVKRAQAAQVFFASQGIASARMRVKSFGGMRPVRKCDDTACKVQNRRVVTVLDTEIGS